MFYCFFFRNGGIQNRHHGNVSRHDPEVGNGRFGESPSRSNSAAARLASRQRCSSSGRTRETRLQDADNHHTGGHHLLDHDAQRQGHPARVEVRLGGTEEGGGRPAGQRSAAATAEERNFSALSSGRQSGQVESQRLGSRRGGVRDGTRVAIQGVSVGESRRDIR